MAQTGFVAVVLSVNPGLGKLEKYELKVNLVPRSHSVTGNVRSGKVRQYTLFYWLLIKRLRQCNLRSDLLISWGTSVKVK